MNSNTIPEDELIEQAARRLEWELSLDTTQAAHARQILHDLSDAIEARAKASQQTND